MHLFLNSSILIYSSCLTTYKTNQFCHPTYSTSAKSKIFHALFIKIYFNIYVGSPYIMHTQFNARQVSFSSYSSYEVILHVCVASRQHHTVRNKILSFVETVLTSIHRDFSVPHRSIPVFVACTGREVGSRGD